MNNFMVYSSILFVFSAVCFQFSGVLEIPSKFSRVSYNCTALD